jgi:hypothetical protein
MSGFPACITWPGVNEAQPRIAFRIRSILPRTSEFLHHNTYGTPYPVAMRATEVLVARAKRRQESIECRYLGDRFPSAAVFRSVPSSEMHPRRGSEVRLCPKGSNTCGGTSCGP